MKPFQIIASAYLALLIGASMMMAGKMPDHPNEPFPADLPIQIGIMFGAAAFFGFMAGRESKE